MFINNSYRFCSLRYEKYHPQIFLEECKYVKENIETILNYVELYRNYIDKELKSEPDSDSDSDNDSDNDSDIDSDIDNGE